MIVAATERMSKCEFSADVDWNTFPSTKYTCPSCGGEISFCLEDFDKHWLSKFTNLSEEDAQTLEKEVAGELQDCNSFLDFYCPGCHRSVRIYYQAWAGGK